jgi:hypothetical protein
MDVQHGRRNPFRTVIGPYWADSGDIIIVSDDAVVSSDEFNAGTIDNRSVSDDGLSIIVDGKITITGEYGDGIRLLGPNLTEGGLEQGSNLIGLVPV